MVVICLKNRTFAVSQTTRGGEGIDARWLWFAWKIVLLQYRKQHGMNLGLITGGCDLLEKSYFCSIANNIYPRVKAIERLWFAWKIVLLQYRKQHEYMYNIIQTVVICLKNRTFAVSQTTWWRLHQMDTWLWFAWKIVLLQYRKQRHKDLQAWSYCCDLLEKSYFCSIANNYFLRLFSYVVVVICLKNRTFAVSQTTVVHFRWLAKGLWFAWKIVLLQYRKQLIIDRFTRRYGCDLLEKSYFCSIANNHR